MKNFSNLYIFTFSAVLVLVVAAALSFTSLQLNDAQQRNIKIETKRNILSSLGVTSTADNAEDLYAQYIKESLVVNPNGEVVPNMTAESVVVKDQIGKQADRLLPLYKAEIDGQSYVVIPVSGKGLWGAIWGYVSLASDMNTVKGVMFDHKSETPGLGAEITSEGFKKNFPGKQIHNTEGKFVSITVAKKGTYTPDNHTVDAISGGTITSKGLDAMLKECMAPYEQYFEKSKLN